MSELSEMPVVTVEQITRFRERAMRVEQQRDELMAALKELIEMSGDIPDSNCSCHINPPCNDCVNYSEIREAMEYANKAIAKAGA